MKRLVATQGDITSDGQRDKRSAPFLIDIYGLRAYLSGFPSGIRPHERTLDYVRMKRWRSRPNEFRRI
jgi:hypothetical protein